MDFRRLFPRLEQRVLGHSKLHGFRAFCVVIRHMVDPRAHGIAPHQPSIVGLQHLGRRTHIPHTRIKPQIVAVWIKDNGHAVVDCGCNGVWGRRQNRAGLKPIAACILPAVPQSSEREQLPTADLEGVRLLTFFRALVE
jgi:hypothetical protein